MLGVQNEQTLRAFYESNAHAVQPSCLKAIMDAVQCSGGEEDKYDVADDDDHGTSSGCFGGVCCMCVFL